MAVTDLWFKRDKSPTRRNGVGMRWRVVVDGHPSKSFRTKGAAVAHELSLLSAGPVRPPAETTVGDLVDPWLSGKAYLSKSGLNAVKAGAGRVRERWGDVPVDAVYPHEVQAWISGMTVADHPASSDTKSKALGALRGALDIAVQTGLIDSNPASAKLGRSVKRDPRFLTVEQLRALAAASGTSAPMVWLLGTTGLRIGECCRLNVEDVTKRGGKWRVRVRKSKNGKPRDVPVPTSVAAMLPLDRPGTAPLFAGQRGGRVSKDTWRRRQFKPAREAAQLDLRIHDLRHTAASLMIASGATVKDVQAALGHASAKMTLDLYAGHWDSGLDDVSARMDALIA